MAAAALLSTGTTAFAGTIPFTVTVGGTGTQDPISRREQKANDGDKYAYFTGITFSNSGEGIYVRSYKLDDSNSRSNRANLRSEKAGVVMKGLYKDGATAGAYYYMKAKAVSGRITVTGRYCP